MRPLRSIPRPQFGYASSVARTLLCGRCGEEYRPARAGEPVGLHHVREDGSGELDEELDRDHRPVTGDYHDDEERDES